MTEESSCADCLNLGRAIYCMQCARMNKGRKDMFMKSTPSTEVSYTYREQKPSAEQPAKR